MKKKMSVLVALVMAVAITSYSVSGTYARYTSSVDFTDEARVAKWELVGIDAETSQITNTLKLFADSYSVNEKGLYVKSWNGENVVAPGTKGEYQVNFAGNMEVRYMLNLGFEGEDMSVFYGFMPDGRFYKSTGNYAPAGVTLKEYAPITYTITLYDGTNIEGQFTGKYNEIVEKIDAWNKADTTKVGFEPGRLHHSCKIEWQWDADNEVEGLTEAQVNELDTYMGEELSSDGAMNEFKLTVTATQVAENHAVR